MSKPERDKTWIRIGKNIMAIKEANGMTNEEFSTLLGYRISTNKLSKATSGLVHFDESELFLISSRTGINLDDISTLDTKTFIEKHNLYKNSRTYEKGKTITQLIMNNEIGNHIKMNSELFENAFMLLDDKQSLKTNSFRQAKSLLQELEFYDEEALDEIINLYKKSISEGATAVAYANILSLFSRFFLIASLGMNKDEMMNYLAQKPQSELDVSAKLLIEMKADTARKQKRALFEKYGELYDQCFYELFESKKYQDLGEFLWCSMYMFKIKNPNHDELTDEECSVAWEHLFILLITKGNKYALDYYNKHLEKFIK